MYAKVFASLWAGSLFGKLHAQVVFIYLLAHSDRDGGVRAVPAAIAAATGMSIDEAMRALAELENPDPESGTPDDDGRRLRRIGPGRWEITNYLKYRAIRNSDDRLEQTRAAVQRHRCKPLKAKVSQGKPQKAQGDVEGEADGEEEVKKKKRTATIDREITLEQIKTCSLRFKLHADVVRFLAEKIQLEFDARGYKNAYSALLTWCKREAERLGPAGAEPPESQGRMPDPPPDFSGERFIPPKGYVADMVANIAKAKSI